MVLPLEGKNKIHLFNSMTSLFLDCTYCSVFVIDIHIIFEHTCQNLGVETSLVKKIAEDRKNYEFNGGAQSIKSFSFFRYSLSNKYFDTVKQRLSYTYYVFVRSIMLFKKLPS